MALLSLLLWFLSAAGAPAAQPPETSRIVRLIEARYSGARTLRAVFLERYMEKGRLIRSESGRVFFRRPGKMRWEYESPEAKLFVSDGRVIWFYVAADRTAMRGRVKDDADERTPFALLTKDPRIAQLCASVTAGTGEQAATAGNLVLHCRPRGSKSGAQGAGEILLEVAPQTGELSRVRVDEGGGSAIEFSFSQWEKNAAVEDSLFRFAPPLGVAIVEAPSGGEIGEQTSPQR